jgi:CHAT domain-containing protein
MLASTQMELGRYDDSTQTLDDVEFAAGGDVTSERLIIRADLHLRQGDPERAIILAQDALRIHRPPTDGTDHRNKAHYLGTLARGLATTGRPIEAIDALRDAIAVVENAKEQWGGDAIGLPAFLEGYVGFYTELVELLVACGDADEAFRVTEQMKSRGLREAIETAHIDLSSSLSDAERRREGTLEGRVVEINRALLEARQKEESLTELEHQLADARENLDAMRAEIRLAHPSVSRRRVDAEFGFELPASKEPLALVEYVVTPRQVIAFTMTRGSSVRATAIPIQRTQLEHDVREIENLLAARSPEYRAMARKLYDKLLAPVERELPADATVVIVPDGVLWSVPFHALVARDGENVIDHHAIFYAHSLHLLRQASSLRGATQPRLLALGNPRVGTTTRSTLNSAYRDTPLDPLVDAEVEVRSVSSMYPAERQRVFYGADATELAFKSEAPRFSVIHIAAHALVDDRAPLYSAIVLAQGHGGTEDGLLEAREVVDLPLSADLAVLSACDTARGKVRAGEGVVGLSWAFFAAGCPTTVVSQWRAESAATSLLMIELHRRLRAGDSTAEAIRHAQLAVRANPKYRHPFYWAPFIAIGAAER